MEEIEKSVTPLLAQAQEIWHLVMEGILSGLSLPHVIAVGVSLVVALLVHRWVRRLVLRVETRIMWGALAAFIMLPRSVKTRTGTEALISNRIWISTPVTNWSFSDRAVRRNLMIGVAYSPDVEVAQPLRIPAARKVPRVLQDPV